LGLNLGGGTTLPGRVALKIKPDILSFLEEKFSQIILVTGVNGKTTTARMIAHGLSDGQIKIVQNRTGGNLLWGVVSTAIIAPRNSVALFEVDEAAIYQVVKFLKPNLVLFHNLGRDQLDRYGEIDNIWKKWAEIVKDLPKDTKIVLNADDPFTASLKRYAKGQVYLYGVSDTSVMSNFRPAYADARLCLECGSPLRYKKILISHSGYFYCPNCKFRRPTPTVSAGKVAILGNSSKMVIEAKRTRVILDVPLIGLFNAVNALAATTALMVLGLNLEKIAKKISTFSGAFGRFEKIKAGAKFLEIILIKNPAGATEVLREFQRRKAKRAGGINSVGVQPWHKIIVVGINDKLADGTDVSWLWDAEFELLSGQAAKFLTTGTRALDMALRLKYAGVPEKNICVESDLNKAIKLGLEKISEGETLPVLLTYTALLETKKILAKKGIGKHYWKD
jgi:UDP-N-acetylmuramyl tripeptide synthase